MTLQTVRNIVLLVLGAVILFIEIEFQDPSRVWVIALALVFMGVVTVDQALSWWGLNQKTPPAVPPPTAETPAQD